MFLFMGWYVGGGLKKVVETKKNGWFFLALYLCFFFENLVVLV